MKKIIHLLLIMTLFLVPMMINIDFIPMVDATTTVDCYLTKNTTVYNGSDFWIRGYFNPTEAIGTIKISVEFSNALFGIESSYAGTVPNGYGYVPGTISNASGTVNYTQYASMPAESGNYSWFIYRCHAEGTGTAYMNWTYTLVKNATLGDCTEVQHDISFSITEAPSAPGDPTGISVAEGSTWLNVTWTADPDATTTRIESGSSNYSTWNPGDHSLRQNTSAEYYNYTGLSPPGLTVYFKLWSWNASGYSTGVKVDGTLTAGTPANDPPYISSPSPSDGDTSVSLSQAVNVVIEDPEGDSFNYTIEISSGDNVSVSGASNGTKFCSHDAFSYSTTYTWWVNITGGTWDEGYDPTNGTYTFSTIAPVNTAPNIPLYPHPENNSTSIYPLVNFSVVVTDPDDDDLDVYFFNANTTNIIPIQEDLESYVYDVPSGERAWMWYHVPENTTFYWYTMSWDGAEWSNQSETWHFTTIDASPGYHTPNLPSNPSPYNNQLNVPRNVTVSWYISHPDGPREMLVELYRGTDPGSMSLIETWSRYGNQTMTDLWTGLTYNEDYYWRVDVTGALQPYAIVGDTWHFKTGLSSESYHIGFNVVYYDSNSETIQGIGDVNISWYRLVAGISYSYQGSTTTDSNGMAYVTTGASVATLYYWDFVPPSGYVAQYKVKAAVNPGSPYIKSIYMDKVGEAGLVTVIVAPYEPLDASIIRGVNLTVQPGYQQPDLGIHHGDNDTLIHLLYFDTQSLSDYVLVDLNKTGYYNVTGKRVDIYDGNVEYIEMRRIGNIASGNQSNWGFEDFFDIFHNAEAVFGLITPGNPDLGRNIVTLIILAVIFYFAYTRIQLYGAVVIVFFASLVFVTVGWASWYMVIIPLIPVLIPFASKFANTVTGNRGNGGNGG